MRSHRFLAFLLQSPTDDAKEAANAAMHRAPFTITLAGLTGMSLAATPIHYAPASTNLNNLTFVLNGTGTNGIYNSSLAAASSYGGYNWCNMPHVRTQEYIVPSSQYSLQYVEVIHRHHKRTPYASNTFFKEDTAWSCTALPLYYAQNYEGSATAVGPISWAATRDPANPFAATVGPGFVNSTCQFPQITDGGLVDSHQHGLDLSGVYHKRLQFLPKNFDPKLVSFRVTNNPITSQVLGALITGLYPKTKQSGLVAAIQSSAYDSLEPTYHCPTGDSVRSNYEGSNSNWTAHLSAAASLYAKLDSVSGIATADTAGWHTSFDHYFDNLSAKQCHGFSLPCSVNATDACITQEEANKVYRLGQYEYSYRYRGAQNSTLYSNLHYGAFLLELQSHLTASIAGKSPMKYRHNVAHDGSISPLLGILQISEMVWPGMGSELVFELWESKGAHYIRVLWGGRPLKTSTPLGTLDLVPIEAFFMYLEAQLPSDLRKACGV